MEQTKSFLFYLALCLPIFLSAAQYITLDIPMDNSLDAEHQSYITKKYYFVTYFKVIVRGSVQCFCVRCLMRSIRRLISSGLINIVNITTWSF